MLRPYLVFIAILVCACAPTTKRVVLISDGERRVFDTQAVTVEDVLREQQIPVGEYDRVDPPLFAEVGRSATITVTRVETRVESVSQLLPFTRQIVRDETYPQGQPRVLQLGANGSVAITYTITIEDGKETGRRETARKIIAQPKDEVLAFGTQGSIPSVPISGTLAYLSYRNAWVMRQSSGEKRPLTASGDLDGRVLSLSADGRYLLFSRAASDAANALNALWIVDTLVSGDAPRPLGVNDVLWAQLATDARALAYTTGEKIEGAPGWKARNDLWVAPLALGDGNVSLRPAQQVWKPAFPAPYSWWGANFVWASDNRSIAYAFSNEIGFVDAGDRATDDNRTPRRALKTFAPFRTRADWVWTPQIAWSPDSRFIIGVVHAPLGNPLAASDDPTFEVWALARDGSVSAPLAKQTGMWSAPTWSPANARGESRIAFGVSLSPSDSERSRYALEVMDRDGGNKRRIFPQADETGLTVVQSAWSPSAQQLAAIRDGDVWLYDFATNRWAQLTANSASSLPRWAR
ncbi:MAG: G5 domain-containing protein [Chloroflexi bacterium]|nr:G5 domain-containing protein [Chloroflexota bacterium]